MSLKPKPNLDDAFFPALVSFAQNVGVPAEWFLNFFYQESVFDPSAFNGKYGGLNQIDMVYLKNHFKVDMQDYLTWSASDQLTRVIAPFMKGQLNYLGVPPTSPGVLYALNVFPASVKSRGISPDTVIMGRDSSNPYEVKSYYANANNGQPNSQGNCGLDFDCSGAITIGDLDQKLAALTTYSTYQTALRKLYAAGAGPWVPTVVPPFTLGQTLIAFGLIGAFFAAVSAAGVMVYLDYERPRHRNPQHIASDSFLNMPEDMKWLRAVHLPGLSPEFTAAMIYGSEDSPDRIEVYTKNDYRAPREVYIRDRQGTLRLVKRVVYREGKLVRGAVQTRTADPHATRWRRGKN